MNISFITTVNHNVGDDFIRAGIEFLLKQKFNQGLRFSYVHKHVPATSRYGFSKLRNLRWSERIERFIPVTLTPDKILQADLVIQSGAPLYWYHKGRTDSVNGNEWYKPLIERRFKNNGKAKLWNISAGTCQKYDSDGSEFLERDATYIIDFIRRFYDMSQITIVRDNLSKSILNSIGLNPILLPCASIFAVDNHEIEAKEPEYVVVNYMPGGGHFDFDPNINKTQWDNNFKEFVNDLSKTENVIAICHNKSELEATRQLVPTIETFFSENYVDYLHAYSKAKFGFVNRVHAGFAMGSMGIQSLIIGSDSRARMASMIGIESIYVNDANLRTLNGTLKKFSKLQSEKKDEILSIKKCALEDYMMYLAVNEST